MANVAISNMSVTWNNAGTTYTAIKMNATDTASAAGSSLLDLQIGGASRFSVGKAGNLVFPSGTQAVPAIAFVDNGQTGFYSTLGGSFAFGGSGRGEQFRWTPNGNFTIGYSGTIRWSSASADLTPDLILIRDAANTLAQRNALNAQTFRVYNTYTSATNYELGKLEWASNVLRIGTEKGSAGGTARALELQTDGTTRLTLATTGDATFTGSVTTSASTANTSSIASSGYSLTGSSAVSLMDLAGTWNTSGTPTAIKLNITDTASNAASVLMALQTNGNTQFYVTKVGQGHIKELFVNPGNNNVPFGVYNQTASVGGVRGVVIYPYTGNINYLDGSNNILVSLTIDAANTFAQRNATNAQTLRVYGTYTDGSNYVRASLASTSSAVTLAAETAGSGADDITLNLTAAGTGTVKANSNLEIADAKDVVLATTTGTKIGTATTQKLGFWNAAPIVQPTTAIAAATVAATGTGDVVAASTTFDGYTIPQIVKAMRDAGLLA